MGLIVEMVKKEFDPILDNRSVNASPLIKKPMSSSSSSRKSSDSGSVKNKRLESPNPVRIQQPDFDGNPDEKLGSPNKKPVSNAKSALNFMLKTKTMKNSARSTREIGASVFARLLGKHSESDTVSQTNHLHHESAVD